MLQTYTIPNLSQGVSQQPDAQRDPTQGEIQVNGVSSISEGLRKRDSTRTIAKVSNSKFGDAYIHTILRDTTEEYLAVITSTGIKVFDLEGTEFAVETDGTDGYSYLSGITDARTQLRAQTIADYTFVTNRTTLVKMDTATAPETARPFPYEALIWIKAANYGQEYKVTCQGETAAIRTAIQPVESDGDGNITQNRISTAEIAQLIIDDLKKKGVTVTFVREGSVIWVRHSAPFDIGATDARANADITVIIDRVQVFVELPTIAPVGYQVEITGDPGTNFDNYYVEFEPKSGNFGEGNWNETVSPGVEYKADPATWPHALVRLPSGDFYFGQFKGQTVEGVEFPTWGQRTCGDYDTAPDPSFIEQPINDIGVYKGRLFFLADENIILSRTREFFQFFPETVTTVLDTDPIDVVASNNRVSILQYAVPYQDELILFSDQYQFRFNAAETVLTPATAQITILTQFEIDSNVRPQQAAGGILFVQANDQWSQFREFSVRGAGTALTADAQDLTGYASSYVPDKCFRMTVNDTGNSAYIISNRNDTGGTDYRKRIYTYRWFFRNTGSGSERAQSSWSYFEFEGVDRILQVVCIKEVVYLLMEYGDEVWLEEMPVMDRMEDDVAAPFPILLDRRTGTDSSVPPGVRMAKGTYDPVEKQTTFTLPYDAKAKTQVWSAWNFGVATKAGGVLLGETSSGRTITARGDWSDADVWAGEPYDFTYRFSRFKLVDEIGGGKAAVNSFRTQVRYAKLRYHESGFFQIKVLPENRKENVYTYDGTISGVKAATIGLPTTFRSDTQRFYEGVFSIPIMSRGERAIVEIHNDSPYPCKFSTCEWMGLITGKGKR